MLQSGIGEDAESFGVAHQNAAGLVLMHMRRHAGDGRTRVDDMRRAQKGLADPRQGQCQHLALAVALRQRAELV
ncbi:hypothetical protein D3C84_1159430 [compost metagenome]